MISQLQLDEFRLKGLELEVREVATSEGGPHGLNVKADFNLFRSIEGIGFRVPFSLLFEPLEEDTEFPLKRLKIDVEGDFSFPDGTPEDKWKPLIPANCLAILYGIVRGIVLSVTASVPDGPVTLPGLNIHAMVDEVSRKRGLKPAAKTRTSVAKKAKKTE